MSKIREEYFRLKNLNSDYLSDGVIFSFLTKCNGFNSFEELTINFENQCKNLQNLNDFVSRALSGEPYQYILNSAYFCGLSFYVDKRVLIPRNETEELVIKLKEIIERKKLSNFHLVDACTGSGCIAISLKKMFPNSQIIATDISMDAIDVANINKNRLNVDVDFRLGNLLNPIDEKVDIIISNPPYIKKIEDVDKNVLDYEPHIALFSKNGYEFYEQMFIQSKSILNDKFILAFEIGVDIKDDLLILSKKYFPNALISVMKDIYNNDRFLFIEK